MQIPNNNFISLEGTECSGKSTQIINLKEYYKNNKNIIFTREPGGTKLSEEIRKIIFNNNDLSIETEAYLFATARCEHMQKIIIPNLKQGNKIISDRFIDSSLIYQGIIGGLGIDKTLEINKNAISSIMPYTIFIDITIDELYKRMNKREENSKTRFDLYDKNFHKKVREGYLQLAKLNPNRFFIINGMNDEKEVFNDIINIIDTIFSK